MTFQTEKNRPKSGFSLLSALQTPNSALFSCISQKKVVTLYPKLRIDMKIQFVSDLHLEFPDNRA